MKHAQSQVPHSCHKGEIILIFITWNGFGWTVPLIILGANFLCYNLPIADEARRVLMLIPGMLLSAFLLWFAGNYLNFGDVPPFIIDRNKRAMYRQSRLPAEHRFYYIKMEYWAVLPLGLLLIGFIFFLSFFKK